MLFGIGLTPGVVATIIFALPPIIRLTNLGIRQVGKGFKEAGSSLGLSKLLILIKIEIPLALKTIMAGINQTLMLALSMVVIAALIGAGGLGLYCLRCFRKIRYWFCCHRWYRHRHSCNNIR
jgi:glycine betaine/proline transport system permease protein